VPGLGCYKPRYAFLRRGIYPITTKVFLAEEEASSSMLQSLPLELFDLVVNHLSDSEVLNIRRVSKDFLLHVNPKAFNTFQVDLENKTWNEYSYIFNLVSTRTCTFTDSVKQIDIRSLAPRLNGKAGIHDMATRIPRLAERLADCLSHFREVKSTK